MILAGLADVDDGQPFEVPGLDLAGAAGDAGASTTEVEGLEGRSCALAVSRGSGVFMIALLPAGVEKRLDENLAESVDHAKANRRVAEGTSGDRRRAAMMWFQLWTRGGGQWYGM